MGSCKKYFVYFVSKFKTKMIINVNLAILLITIGSSTARPGGRRDPEAYPYAPAPDAEGRQSDWPRAPLEVAAAPTEHIEEPYRKSKAPRNARQHSIAPLVVPAAPAAPVAESAYKNKNKEPRQARASGWPAAPVEEPAAPAAPVAESAYKSKRKAPRQARAHPYAPLDVAAEPYAPAAPVEEK